MEEMLASEGWLNTRSQAPFTPSVPASAQPPVRAHTHAVPVSVFRNLWYYFTSAAEITHLIRPQAINYLPSFGKVLGNTRICIMDYLYRAGTKARTFFVCFIFKYTKYQTNKGEYI